MPFDVSLHNRKHNFTRPNLAVFGNYVQQDYQMQLFLSDYLLESGISALFYADMLVLKNQDIDLTTTELNIALLGQPSRHGFHHGGKCKVDISVIGEAPLLSISKEKGLSFKIQFANDIK